MFFCFDVIPEVSWHSGGKIVIVMLWNPSEDTVELENNARLSSLVTEALLFAAFSSQRRDIKVAYLAVSWQLVEATCGDVLTMC